MNRQSSRLIAGQAVELVVKRGQIPHRQPPHVARGDQAPGTAAGAGDMFHHRIAHVLHRDAVVADFRAFAPQPPEFALLMTAVSVNEKAAEAQVFDRGTGIVDRFAQNDHRAIGAVRQMQDSRFPGPAQGLMIAPQNNGLADFNHSRRQHHFPAAFRQGIQGPLDFERWSRPRASSPPPVSQPRFEGQPDRPREKSTNQRIKRLSGSFDL